MANEGMIADALNNNADGLKKIAKAIEELCFVIQDKKFEVTTYDGDL